MQTLVERPDLAGQIAAAGNSDIYPNYIAEIQPGFGVVETTIYIYNIGIQEFSAPRPPNHPHLLIRRCPPEKACTVHSTEIGWELVGRISNPFRQIEYDQNNNRRVMMTDGYVEATRMLNPSNPGTNQDYDAPTALNENGNLNAFGVFWSKHHPPLREELEAARRRMANTYDAKLRKMDDAAADSDPTLVRQMADRTAHAACEYFGQVRPWHPNFNAKNDLAGKSECPNCGEMIRAGAPFHALGAAVCVLDWRKAVEAGVKQIDDVPPARRWWTEDGDAAESPRRGRRPS